MGEQFRSGLGFGEHELDSQLIGRRRAGRGELGGDGDSGYDGLVDSKMWAGDQAGAD